ncbi:hypothetical protein B296_00036478 [Ensete ventricosum]|uniref:Uncharacterized protein n=1 Tax=Ensete ventricosum TaxID=4639 RepID=A0A426XJM9_ENSVE|nr:hypothetical protein B296_00036478 [Ensete ventricosum]
MARVDPSIAVPDRLLIYYGIFLLPFFFFFFSSSSVDASVHSYVGEKFAPKGNAFVIHGGSEGLYASLPDPNATAGRGDAFIRYSPLVLTSFYKSGAPLIRFVGFRALWGFGMSKDGKLGLSV